MSKCIFDIETDGLLDTMTKVHCIVIYDIDNDKMHSFDGQVTRLRFDDALFFLKNFSEIIGHNILNFDLPALKAIFKYEPEPTQIIRDTLVWSKLVYPNRGQRDADNKAIDKDQYGRHSLKSWGQRLNFPKNEFDEFEEFTQDMLEYCENDVELNYKLYCKLLDADFSEESIQLEHEIHTICLKQTDNGFPFDVEKATKLYAKLAEKRDRLQKELKEVFGSWIVDEGERKNGSYNKIKIVDFNPNSRKHIAKRLTELRGWKPKEFTPTDEPKVDEDILSKLDFPEAQLMAEAFRVNKLIAQLSEGKHAWLYHEKNGRIHGSVNTMGSISSRCSHSHPNIGQVPSVKTEYGKECRELFYAPQGWSLLGCDISSLEIRVVSHYLASFDGGSYAKTVVNGDIHEANRKAADLPSRDQAKTFIYGLLYGAGEAKLGQIVGKDKGEGRKLKNRFFKKVPAFQKLREKVFKKAERGYLFGLDGRKVPVRSKHSALNTLCQSAGAIVCKKWVVEFHKMMDLLGFKEDVDYQQVAFVHDEIQVLVRSGLEDEVGKVAVKAITKSGALLNLRVPLTGEYNFGSNWAETH